MSYSSPPPKIYVGRISHHADKRDVEELFDKYGRVLSVEMKHGGYAFVEFEDSRDAEDAVNALHGYDLRGSRLVVEWSRRSGKPGSGCFLCGDPGHWARECPDAREKGLDVKSGLCFKCGQPGHLARFCQEREGRGGYSRGGRGRSYSPRRRSYSRSRSRSRSGSPYNRRYDSRRRSRSRSRSPYGRRSPGYSRRSRSPGYDRRDRPTSRERSPVEDRGRRGRSPREYGRSPKRGERSPYFDRRERSPYEEDRKREEPTFTADNLNAALD